MVSTILVFYLIVNTLFFSIINLPLFPPHQRVEYDSALIGQPYNHQTMTPSSTLPSGDGGSSRISAELNDFVTVVQTLLSTIVELIYCQLILCKLILTMLLMPYSLTKRGHTHGLSK